MGVEGAEIDDVLEFPRPTEELGRIAAQTAKQIIFQKVREAERNNIYEEYIERVGELINGYVKRFEGGRMIVDLGNGSRPSCRKSQQSRDETFTQSERIRVVIHDVNKDSKGPQIEVSRTSPELIKRLFEMEVPEIYDGTVVIKAAVREPGDRAKIAVVSQRARRRPGRRVRRYEGLARAVDHPRAARREDRHHRVVRGPGDLRRQRSLAGQGLEVQIIDFENKELEVIVAEDQLIARHRQARAERPPRGQARRLGHRHPQRGGDEARGRDPDGAAHLGAVVPLTVVEGIDVADSRRSPSTGSRPSSSSPRPTRRRDDECLDLSFDDAERLLASARLIVEARRARARRRMQAAAPDADESWPATSREDDEGRSRAGEAGGAEAEGEARPRRLTERRGRGEPVRGGRATAQAADGRGGAGRWARASGRRRRGRATEADAGRHNGRRDNVLSAGSTPGGNDRAALRDDAADYVAG